MGFRVEDETDEERAEHDKRRIAERLEGPEAVPMFAGFMMAAIASGKSAKGASNEAELCMTELRKRFT